MDSMTVGLVRRYPILILMPRETDMTERDDQNAGASATTRLNDLAPFSVRRPTDGMGARPIERSATTSGEWLRQFHDDHSPLGRVRVVCWPVEDGDGAVALHDFEPFDNE